MNKVRRLAEDLVNRYPTLFSADFDKNKAALEQVTIVRTRSLRNQLAGAITKIMHGRAPAVIEEEKQEAAQPATIQERAQIEGSVVKIASETRSEGTAKEPKSKEEQKASTSASTASESTAEIPQSNAILQ